MLQQLACDTLPSVSRTCPYSMYSDQCRDWIDPDTITADQLICESRDGVAHAQYRAGPSHSACDSKRFCGVADEGATTRKAWLMRCTTAKAMTDAADVHEASFVDIDASAMRTKKMHRRRTSGGSGSAPSNSSTWQTSLRTCQRDAGQKTS